MCRKWCQRRPHMQPKIYHFPRNEKNSNTNAEQLDSPCDALSSSSSSLFSSSSSMVNVASFKLNSMESLVVEYDWSAALVLLLFVLLLLLLLLLMRWIVAASTLLLFVVWLLLLLLFDWELALLAVVATSPFDVCNRMVVVVVAFCTGKMHTSDGVDLVTGVQSTYKSASLMFIITLCPPQWLPSINIGVLSRNVFVVIAVAAELLKKYCVGCDALRDEDWWWCSLDTDDDDDVVVADEEDGVAVTKILFPFVSLPLAAVKLMLPNTTIVEFGCVALCSSCILLKITDAFLDWLNTGKCLPVDRCTNSESLWSHF